MRVLELFAGAGGAALGLERAGLRHAALCEWDRDACATLRAAGLGPVVEGDVRDLDRIAAVAGAVDVLWSSFPCQAWSRAGKRRGAADERNGWPWTVAALDRFRPAWFLGENVRGLAVHQGGCPGKAGGPLNPEGCPGCYLEGAILPDLRARFAYVGWWLLDAADYGVPQHRRRIVLWAGPRPLTRPAPTHGPGRAAPWVGMGEALGLRARADDGPLARPAPTVTTTEEKGTRATAASGYTFHGGPDRASDALFLGTGRRRLTLAECAILQDFPEEYPFQGSIGSRYRQIGNAVPPRLAEVVGGALLAAAEA